MVGAILAQNTSWQNVEQAIANIKAARLLSPELLFRYRRRLPGLIRPSGFYRLKSKRLLTYLRYYLNHKKIKGRATKNIRKELLAIPGIGYETADSILLYAFNRPTFVIDAYTRRIFSRHKIINGRLAYDDVKGLFESSLPRKTRTFNEYHALIVKLGKTYCRKHEPLCHHCPLNSIQQ